MSCRIHFEIVIVLISLGILTTLACYKSSAPGHIMTTSSITFRVSDKTPEKVDYDVDRPAADQIKWLPEYRENNCTEILQTSKFPSKMHISKNGFVNTVVDAYNRHYKLIIRPDDVWGAIMTQFSFYINKHAEEFRGKFVNFTGKKELEVTVEGTLRNAPYDLLVKLMTAEINKNLVDPELKQWILPNFSTTTDDDLVTIGVVFMASMKKYFDYSFMLACGIPSITLEGSVEDWINVHQRLEKLKEYKLEGWYEMLEKILQQFVKARQGKVDLDFWQRIVHYQSGGSGPDYISGWMTVFCAFDEDGNWQGGESTHANRMEWLEIDTDKIPSGIVEVDVKIDDNGVEHKSVMFAGHMGAEVKKDGVTVQPTLGWVMALKS